MIENREINAESVEETPTERSSREMMTVFLTLRRASPNLNAISDQDRGIGLQFDWLDDAGVFVGDPEGWVDGFRDELIFRSLRVAAIFTLRGDLVRARQHLQFAEMWKRDRDQPAESNPSLSGTALAVLLTTLQDRPHA